jgi:hypothetical protein
MCPDFRGRVAFGSHQRRPKGDLQRQFVLAARRCVGQCVEQRQSRGELSDRFGISRSVGRLLPSKLEVYRCFDTVGAVTVVMRQFAVVVL